MKEPNEQTAPAQDEARNADTQGQDDYRRIQQFVRDFVFETHRFPQVNDIVELTGIRKQRCDELVDQLVAQKQLYVVFEGPGLPRIVLPRDMMQNVIMTQKRPSWIEKYSFKERGDIESNIKELEKEKLKFDMFERILYLTDIPLEEAVQFTLSWLGFSNVHHHVDQKDYADVTFERDGTKALVEVEGPTKQGDKQKVLQLDGWVRVEIEKTNRSPEDIQGFFVVNHFRTLEPEARGPPLTDQAKKFMIRYRFRLLTTPFIFQTVKRVMERKITTEEARIRIWEGESIP